MKLKPIITEKSIEKAKEGEYIFLVDLSLTKPQIKNIIHDVFGVDVTSVRTMLSKPGVRKDPRGRLIRKKAAKKAIVKLKEKQSIDLFEEKKKGKK